MEPLGLGPVAGEEVVEGSGMGAGIAEFEGEARLLLGFHEPAPGPEDDREAEPEQGRILAAHRQGDLVGRRCGPQPAQRLSLVSGQTAPGDQAGALDLRGCAGSLERPVAPPQGEQRSDAHEERLKAGDRTARQQRERRRGIVGVQPLGRGLDPCIGVFWIVGQRRRTGLGEGAAFQEVGQPSFRGPVMEVVAQGIDPGCGDIGIEGQIGAGAEQRTGIEPDRGAMDAVMLGRAEAGGLRGRHLRPVEGRIEEGIRIAFGAPALGRVGFRRRDAAVTVAAGHRIRVEQSSQIRMHAVVRFSRRARTGRLRTEGRLTVRPARSRPAEPLRGGFSHSGSRVPTLPDGGGGA